MRVAMQGKQGQKVVSLSSPPPLSPLTPPGKNTTVHLVQQISVTLCNKYLFNYGWNQFEIQTCTSPSAFSCIATWVNSTVNKVDEDNQKMIGKQNNQQVEKKSLLFVEVNRDLEQP